MDRMTILCIDDENIVLRSLKNELSYIFDGTFSVEVAESGQEALDILLELSSKKVEVPVVISDYIMPGMKGDELLKRIHTVYPDIITVLLTGRAVTQGVINAINYAGLFRYIEKPWTKEELESTVKKAVDQYLANKKAREERENLLNMRKHLESEALQKRNELLALREKIKSEYVCTDIDHFYQYLHLINEIRDFFKKTKTDLQFHHSPDCKTEMEIILKQMKDFLNHGS